MNSTMLRAGSLLLASLALAGPRVAASASIEARLGGAWNVPLPLAVEQGGEEELRLTARWASRAFDFPLYYGVRVATGARDQWALDLTHHKVHLTNPPSEIESFAISHGFNLLVVQRHFEERGRRAGLGAGVVIAHPENRVRGRSLDEHGGLAGSGYHLAGPCLDLLGGHARSLGRGLFASAELRVTLAYARVPVADGHARLPNVALHGTVGIGWRESR